MASFEAGEWKDQVAVKSTKPRATLRAVRCQQLLFSLSLFVTHSSRQTQNMTDSPLVHKYTAVRDEEERAGGRREHVTTKSKCKTQIKTLWGNFSVRLYISSWKVSKVLGFLLLMQQTTLYDFFKSPSLQVMSRFLHVSSMYANFINQHAGYLPELRLPVPLVSTMSKRCSFMEISINPAPSCTYSIHYMGDLFIFKEE